MSEISNELIKKYALENAIKYNGKCNANSILSSLFSEGLKKEEIKDYMPKIQKIVSEVNSLELSKQKEEFENSNIKTSKREVRIGLPELPNVKEKVIMRMAPFPSGPLHIGNARTTILNDEYVKKYGGKLILFMDDTIGSSEKQIEPEAYKLIEEGVKWLGVDYKEILYKSDRIEKYYAYAEEMIKKGYMYVCDCNSEDWKKLKEEGKECPCRQYPGEIQIKRWKKMFECLPGSMCVRLKTSMKDPDPAFRDRVMFKVSNRPHPRTKNKYSIYPSMEFSWAIDDSLIGTTHVLRGIEHQMSTRVQDFIRKIFGWKNPESIYNGLFEIEGVKISKSKGSKEVKSGSYIGWNDPRTWSLQSLRDRGFQKEAIRKFIIELGIRKTNIKVPIEVLYTNNRRMIEESPRYFFIEEPQKIHINGCPNLKAKIPLHPNLEKGYKNYETTQDFLISKQDFDLIEQGNYRLMHLLNFKADNTLRLKPKEYSFISEEPDQSLKAKFIHWLPHSPYNIKISIRMPSGELKEGLGERELEKLKEGSIVQFERFGFARLHKKQKDSLEFYFTHP